MVRPGTDATVLAYGPMVRTALDAATAAAEDGRELEVIDLRTLSPLDLGPVYESVRRTGRLVVVHEAPGNLGLGAEIAARVTEECFYSLEAPVLRVTGFDTPYPAARVEEEYLPDLDRVLDAVDRIVRLVSGDVADQGVQPARPRRGPDRGRDPQVAGQGRATRSS